MLTSTPHPQAQRCFTARYRQQTYRIPGSRLRGIWSTNSGATSSSFNGSTEHEGVDEFVTVNNVLTVELPFKIAVEAPNLFPLYDGERGVQRIQFGELNVSLVLVSSVTTAQVDAVCCVVMVGTAHRSRSKSPRQRIADAIQAHPNVDEKGIAWRCKSQ